MAAVVDEFRKRGAAYAVVWTFAGNIRGRGFYEAVVWSLHGEGEWESSRRFVTGGSSTLKQQRTMVGISGAEPKRLREGGGREDRGRWTTRRTVDKREAREILNGQIGKLRRRTYEDLGA